MKLSQFLILLGVIVLGFGAIFFVLSPSGTGGELFMQKPSFVQGFYAGLGRQFTVDSSGAVTNSGSATFSGAVTLSGETTLGNCGSKTFNPPSLATGTLTAATSTDVAVTGAALGDVCIASLTSQTSTEVSVFCAITSSATGTVTFQNNSLAAIDVGTGTLKVCYFD